MTLKSIHSHSIPNGTKLVAIFADGSGADLFMVDDNGDLYDAEFTHYGPAPDTYLIDAGFCMWMELPDGFPFWFEQKEETRP